MYTRKNAQVVAKQTCSNAVPTTCQCVRTACSQHVDNKPLTTTCYKVIELKRLATGSSNNLLSSCNSTICQQVVSDNAVILSSCYKVVTTFLRTHGVDRL
jgi:hypothetical protein